MLPFHRKPALFVWAALLVLLIFPWTISTAPRQTSAGRPPRSLQATPEPAETPTPFPTLTNIGEGTNPGSIVLLGVLLVCAMGLLLAVGVGAAVLLVRLRKRF